MTSKLQRFVYNPFTWWPGEQQHEQASGSTTLELMAYISSIAEHAGDPSMKDGTWIDLNK